MLRVALTGGIATGKSYVLGQFRRLGASCLDADEIAHGVMAAGTEATNAIAARFGADVLDRDGAVDRRRLAPLVFGDASARRDLESIVHPAVRRAIRSGLRGFELVGARVAIADIPLLYETGRPVDFDKVIVTTCPPEVQLARLAARGLSDTEARQRLAAQMPAEEKAGRADFVIRTEGSHQTTDEQVARVWTALTSSP
jgi:dephospho-CoA kinase